MYNFYYEVANKVWPDNEIVFGDTDSIVLKVASKDVYEDLETIKDDLDTSDYPEDHFLHSQENKFNRSNIIYNCYQILIKKY
jgi:hypothetical protein